MDECRILSPLGMLGHGAILAELIRESGDPGGLGGDRHAGARGPARRT